MAEAVLTTEALRLVAPANDEQTGSLQAFAWPEMRSSYAAQPGYPLVPMTDRSQPQPVRLAWEMSSLAPDGWHYDLHLSTCPDLSEARVWTGLAQNSLEISGLRAGTRYYWKVVGHGPEETACESEPASFTTHPALPRWLRVEGITNCRDAGGWPCGEGRRVRQGLVFRSSEMNSHFCISPAGKHLLEEELGIRTDLDLRGDEEETIPCLDPQRVCYVNTPVGAYEEILGDFCKAGLLLAFETLGRRDSYPLLVHCWGGADRTGTLVFLLNGLLGVGLPDLIHDYEATSLSVFGPRLADAGSFQNLLRVLRGFGGPGDGLSDQIQAYLLSIGVKEETLAAIRSILIEPN